MSIRTRSNPADLPLQQSAIPESFQLASHRSRIEADAAEHAEGDRLASLDALIDEAIRRAHPAGRSRSTCRRAFRSISSCARLRQIAARNQIFKSHIGPGLLRLRHAQRHPAERAREPRLVHALHAVSGGDRPGPARRLLNFQTMVIGPDRDGGRQRVAARRSHRRGRSDDAAAPRAEPADRERRGAGAVFRRRFVLSADDRRAARAGGAARHRADRRRRSDRRVHATACSARCSRRRTKRAPSTISANSATRASARRRWWRSAPIC